MIAARRWAIGYAAAALIIGLAYIAATAPFQAPDEVGHYWRAAAIAAGTPFPAGVDGASPAAFVPRGVKETVATTWVATAGAQDATVGFERLRRARSIALQRNDMVEVKFPAHYTPVPYLPEAAVFWIGTLLDAPPLATFYVARVANLLSMIALVVASMFIAPSAAWVFAAAGALPMTLFISASLSPDAMTFGLASLALGIAITERSVRRYRFMASAVALLLGLCKPTYFLIPMLAIWNRRNVRRGDRAGTAAAIVLAALAGFGMSALAASRGSFDMKHDERVNVRRQLAHVLAHPFDTAETVGRDYGANHTRYRHELVGRLGLLDVELPRLLSTLAQVALLAAALTSPRVVSSTQRISGLGMLLAMLFAISLSLYLQWTPVGSTVVEGIQGRYFLPLVALAAICIQAIAVRQVHHGAMVVLFAALTALNATGVHRVFTRYF